MVTRAQAQALAQAGGQAGGQSQPQGQPPRQTQGQGNQPGSTIEKLPKEVLERIYVFSGNFDLPHTSRTMKRTLTNPRWRRVITSKLLLHPPSDDDERERAYSDLIARSFFTRRYIDHLRLPRKCYIDMVAIGIRHLGLAFDNLTTIWNSSGRVEIDVFRWDNSNSNDKAATIAQAQRELRDYILTTTTSQFLLLMEQLDTPVTHEHLIAAVDQVVNITDGEDDIEDFWHAPEVHVMIKVINDMKARWSRRLFRGTELVAYVDERVRYEKRVGYKLKWGRNLKFMIELWVQHSPGSRPNVFGCPDEWFNQLLLERWDIDFP